MKVEYEFKIIEVLSPDEKTELKDILNNSETTTELKFRLHEFFDKLKSDIQIDKIINDLMSLVETEITNSVNKILNE